MGKDKIMEHNKRVEQIKTYLERLSAGEELEKVRADFAKEFKEVDPAEIMQAEQELLQGGTPLETVQKLCDVHAALFRGATSEEKIANAEKAVAASVKEKKLAATAALTGITGHPLQTFTRENEVLENVIRECRNEIEETNTLSPERFGKLREVAIHYAKKGDLLYPHLKVKYGISGPSDVMWTTDDEIRDELGGTGKAAAGSKDGRSLVGTFSHCVAARGGYDLQGSQYFLPELCPEFHGGRVVWDLPRFERLSGLLWCGKCDMGGGREVSAYRKLQ